MRLAWLTDPHLDHLSSAERHQFYATLQNVCIEALVVTGDIAIGDSVSTVLEEFAGAVNLPIYFVLGNHDFYGSSLAAIRAEMARSYTGTSRTVWLSGVGPVPLAEDAFLVGEDGWADARLGRPMQSDIELNDFFLIEELSGLSREQRVRLSQSLGDEAAARLDEKLARVPLVSNRGRRPRARGIRDLRPRRDGHSELSRDSNAMSRCPVFGDGGRRTCAWNSAAPRREGGVADDMRESQNFSRKVATWTRSGCGDLWFRAPSFLPPLAP